MLNTDVFYGDLHHLPSLQVARHKVSPPVQGVRERRLSGGGGSWFRATEKGVIPYPLVNVHITMENHHFSWINQRTKWDQPSGNLFHS